MSMSGFKNVVPEDRKNESSENRIRLIKYSFYVTYCFGDDD
jgi:hypothetical protein